ncbi:TPA: hypothetical protein ACYLN4_000653 [Burkholderia lata]
MEPGDRVTWSFNVPGGYGYVIPVAAIIVKTTASRATITVARKIDNKWVLQEKTVSRAKLLPRTVACEALGET